MTENLVLYGFSGSNLNEMNRLKDVVANLPDTEIVLLQDAVIGLHLQKESSPYSELLKSGKKISYLSEDAEARGLGDKINTEDYKKISYADLIDKIEQSKRLISWI